MTLGKKNDWGGRQDEEGKAGRGGGMRGHCQREGSSKFLKFKEFR